MADNDLGNFPKRKRGRPKKEFSNVNKEEWPLIPSSSLKARPENQVESFSTALVGLDLDQPEENQEKKEVDGKKGYLGFENKGHWLRSHVKRKLGNLSNEEIKFLRENSENIPLKEMAITLNRNEDTIYKKCKELGLKVRSASINEEVHEMDILRRKLRDRPYWGELTKQFIDEELEYFVETWIRMMKQLKEDVYSSEEIQIKQLITLDILGNRVMKDRKIAIEQIDQIQQKLSVEYKKEPVDSDSIISLEEQLATYRAAAGTYTNDYSSVIKQVEGLQKDLKTARSERIKRFDDAKNSFTGLLKLLQEEEQRNALAIDAEVMRMAMLKAKEKYSAFHRFEDGKVDQPFINHETVIDLEVDNKMEK